MSPLHQASFDAHELIIQMQISDDTTELLSSRQGYVEMQDYAGERPWHELSSWSRIVHWYVGSQVLILERNLTLTPRESSLAKVIAYVGRNATEIVDLNHGWFGETESIRPGVQQAAPDQFSKEEAEYDLETLRRVRRAIRLYRLRTGAEWTKLFETMCRDRASFDATGFTLPALEELDFAISAFIDLVVKYVELMTGSPQHSFAVGFALTESGLMRTIANEWRADSSSGPEDECLNDLGTSTELNFTPIHLPT